jgi:hypothetical protein
MLTDLYYRPPILPALANGANHLVYSDCSTGGLERQVTFNWLEDTNILLSEERPCEGDRVTVTALVRNTGDSTARDVQVRFFDGDPAAGGVKIGEDQVISKIAPGETGQALVKWQAVHHHINAAGSFSVAHNTRVTGYLYNTLYVQVDPFDQIPEVWQNGRRVYLQIKKEIVF